jgi:hypothetical protein
MAPSLGIPTSHLPIYTAFLNRVVLLDVPPLNVVVGEGRGDPRRGPRETEIVEALYAISFAVADRLTQSRGFDYGVTPLEALWCREDGWPFDGQDPLRRGWQHLIVQPPEVTPAMFDEERIHLAEQRDLPGLQNLRLEMLREGPSAQILMKGASDRTRISAIEQLTMYAASEEYEVSGFYHEIYLTGDQGQDESRRMICRLPVQAPEDTGATSGGS